MDPNIKKDILVILRGSRKAIKENDIAKLKDLSNHTVHDASIFQDEYSISIAVIIYSIAKIFERPRYREYKTWPIFYNTLTKNLEKAELSLEKDKIDEYEYSIQQILQVIDKLETKLKGYITEVIDKSKISKASRLHEHGVSVARTAELLGISEWDLMDYVGKTGIADVSFALTKSAKDRLKLARKIFKWKA